MNDAEEGIVVLERPGVAVDEPVWGDAQKVVVSFGRAPVYTPGRRSWVKYRELGVTDASERRMRAQVIGAETGDNKPTGWHLHRCEMQFLYVLSGAIHIAFSPDNVVRLGAGDSIMIPGGTMHMELGEPDGVQVLEVSVPADMGTEDCTPPWAGVEIDMRSGRR